MLKFFVWVGLLSFIWWEVETVITKNDIIIEIIRIVSNVVVLIIAPYLAYKLRQNEKERQIDKQEAKVDREILKDKIDKNTEVTVKTTEKVIQTAALTEAERVSKPIVEENQEYFDQLLREYWHETHPERYQSGEETKPSPEKEPKRTN